MTPPAAKVLTGADPVRHARQKRLAGGPARGILPCA